MRNKRLLATLAVGLLLATAGCSQLLTGDASFSASESGVDDADEVGFELNRTEWQNITRTVEAGGEERDISVNNRIQVFLNRSESGTPEAAFAVVTSPQVQVAGQPMNPVADWDNEQILEEFGGQFDQYGSIEELDERDTDTETILDTETEVSTFEATVESDAGDTREVVVSVTKVQHESDFIIAIGVHEDGDEANAEAIEELFLNLDH